MRRDVAGITSSGSYYVYVDDRIAIAFSLTLEVGGKA